MEKVPVFLLICLAVFHQGWALKCFSCNSNSNPACNDPVNIDKMPLTDCNVPPGTTASQTAACMKMHTEDNHTGNMNVTRKCVMSPKNSDACRTASSVLDLTHVKLHHCSTCEVDQCNSAWRQGAPAYSVIALGAATIALALRL